MEGRRFGAAAGFSPGAELYVFPRVFTRFDILWGQHFPRGKSIWH
jgi:hypothetical protein